MPKVGEKEFPYTPEGIQAAAEESSESGIPVSDAGSRNESYQLGVLIPGEEGFGQRPMIKPPLPGTASSLGMYEKGGPVDKKAGRKARREARKEFRERKKEIRQDKKLIKKEKSRESYVKKYGSTKVDYRGKETEDVYAKQNPEVQKRWSTSGGGGEKVVRARHMDEGYDKKRTSLEGWTKEKNELPSKKQLKELKKAAKKEKKAKIKATRK